MGACVSGPISRGSVSLLFALIKDEPMSPSAQEGIRRVGAPSTQRPCNGGQGNIRAHPPIEPARDQYPHRLYATTSSERPAASSHLRSFSPTARSPDPTPRPGHDRPAVSASAPRQARRSRYAAGAGPDDPNTPRTTRLTEDSTVLYQASTGATGHRASRSGFVRAVPRGGQCPSTGFMSPTVCWSCSAPNARRACSPSPC